MSSAAYFTHAAIVRGWPAYAVARLLRRHWDEVEDLPLHLRAPLEDALEALEQAGQRFAAERRATCGPAALESAAPPVVSEAMDAEMTTEKAAGALGVGERYVRKLVAGGELPARQEHGRWLIDPAAIAVLKERRAK